MYGDGDGTKENPYTLEISSLKISEQNSMQAGTNQEVSGVL